MFYILIYRSIKSLFQKAMEHSIKSYGAFCQILRYFLQNPTVLLAKSYGAFFPLLQTT